MIIEDFCALPLELAEALTEIWEASVRATHHFLNPDEILEIKPHVKEALLHCRKILVLKGGYGNDLADELADDKGAGQVADRGNDRGADREKPKRQGFLAIEGNKIEMFFLAPDCLGKGYGKKMLEEALLRHGVKFVDVNEDNVAAQGFYRHMGFRVYERSELDDTGEPYPLLHMVRL